MTPIEQLLTLDVRQMDVHEVKQKLRECTWRRMEAVNVVRFPGAWGRIPNFEGATDAAKLLTTLDEWRSARTLKANPDSPQAPVRANALNDGKLVYMAVPRLRQEKCFVELDPERLGSNAKRASTIRGAFRYGRLVSPGQMPHIDLIVCGSVAVNLNGARVGKGGGYSDLEFGLAVEFGLITDATIIATTVHPVQIVEDDIPMLPHDIPVDIIVTPTEVFYTRTAFERPCGIHWDMLPSDKLSAIPILRTLQKS